MESSQRAYEAPETTVVDFSFGSAICGGLGDRSGFDPVDDNPFGF